MNILLTCVGRRNYLVDYFKEALQPFGGKVHAFNSDSNSAALWQSDYPVISPNVTDPNYPAFLEDYCTTHDIQAIICFLDIELPFLAGLKDRFNKLGITVIVADPWMVEMAHDKWLTYQFLVKHHLNTVPTYIDLHQAMETIRKGELHYPLFVKPRWGMGSIALFKAGNENDLIFYYNKAKEVISSSYLKYVKAEDKDKTILIQATFPGQEYGLDIINDLNGKHVVTVVKQKLAMRSGETDHAITVHHPQLEQLGVTIAGLTQHPANLDMDVFWDGEKAYILELNPRFGGGYPFSHAAGVNLPKAIIAWLRNEPVDIDALLTPKYGIEAMKGIAMIVKSE